MNVQRLARFPDIYLHISRFPSFTSTHLYNLPNRLWGGGWSDTFRKVNAIPMSLFSSCFVAFDKRPDGQKSSFALNLMIRTLRHSRRVSPNSTHSCVLINSNYLIPEYFSVHSTDTWIHLKERNTAVLPTHLVGSRDADFKYPLVFESSAI